MPTEPRTPPLTTGCALRLDYARTRHSPGGIGVWMTSDGAPLTTTRATKTVAAVSRRPEETGEEMA